MMTVDRDLRAVALPVARRQAARMLARLRHMTSDSLDDYLSDALEAVWLHLERIGEHGLDDATLAAHLATVAWQGIIDGVRHRHGRVGSARSRAHCSIEADSETPAVVDGYLRGDDPGYERVEHCQWVAWARCYIPGLLDACTPWQRHVVREHVLHGRTLADVAAERGVTLSAAWQAHRNAIPRMRRAAHARHINPTDLP